MLDKHDIVKGLFELEGILLLRGNVTHAFVEAGHHRRESVVATDCTTKCANESGESVVRCCGMETVAPCFEIG